MNMQENAEFPQGADHTRKCCFLCGPQGPNRSEIGSGWGNYLIPGSTSPVAARIRAPVVSAGLIVEVPPPPSELFPTSRVHSHAHESNSCR